MGSSELHTLSEEQIQVLQQNGCRSTDWTRIRVAAGFDPVTVCNTEFAGDITLGAFSGTIDLGDGIPRACGIRNAKLNDVSVADNCVVADVRGWLSKIDVGSGAVIEGVGSITCTGDTSFGNGHEIDVFNEGGGRELLLTNETNAQVAYLTVAYRDRADLIDALGRMAKAYAAACKSDRAVIGAGARILDSGSLQNVTVGEKACINGVLSLENGTILSSSEAPTRVGPGVIAEDFIMQEGASVTDGAMVAGSLVGQGTRIGKQFSAENCIFLANSEGFHSEACSVFGGPYTVTHHRSTLLIAGMFSFYNAGSGTNQSNHMYKLGPLHQGILERGCKTGSFSYMLWPCRVGAFTAVMGKHYANFDTGDFPFSYISEEDGKSMLVPGMNFFTVGTLRDGEKWPNRDRRTASNKRDLIVFDVLSPYTAQKMLRGSDILSELYKASERGQEYVTWQGIAIKRLLLKTCRRYYKLALDKYLGDVVVKALEANANADWRKVLADKTAGADTDDPWIDVAGLLCRKSRIEALIADIESGTIASFDDMFARLEDIHNTYEDDQLAWVLGTLEVLNGRPLHEEDEAGMEAFLSRWKIASVKLFNMVANDASKEFEGETRIGFGIDGNRDADFDAVRGTFEGNSFVKKLHADSAEIEQRFEKAMKIVSNT